MNKRKSETRTTRCLGKLLRQFAVLTLLLAATASLHAQYELEALRYSRLYQTGTARFSGMGGALGALGGDFSCISNNPAGLGLFRGSQVTVTPSLYFSTTSADYNGAAFDDDKFNFNFGNIGLVYSRRYNKTQTTGLQFLNFALGYQRTNNFNRNTYFEGTDTLNSLAEQFKNNANGSSPASLDPFRELLGFNTYLIDTSGSPSTYFSNGPWPGESKRVANQVSTGGSIGEITLGGSANFSNKFFIGASFAIVTLNFSETSIYSETDVTGSIPVFDNLSFRENVNVSGIGFNLKLGFIYKPVDWFRVGAAFHSPTWYNMSEDYTNRLSTSFAFGRYFSESPVGKFEYDLTTPLRLQGSLGFVVLKNATIGIEYEFADYAAINLRPSSAFFQSANAFIDSAYVVTHNIRLGAEVRIDPFRIRAGYGFMMNPFHSDVPLDATVHSISAGLGYRSKKWFTADVAYMISLSNGTQAMNRSLPALGQAVTGNTQHSIMATFGFNF